MKFPVPKGFEVPAGVEDGKEFDALGTFTISGGQLTLVAVDGARLGESAEKEEPSETEDDMGESEDEGMDFMSAVEKKLPKA